MIVASGDERISFEELLQRIVHEKGIQADWVTSVAIPIFNGKGDIMNCYL